MLTISSLILFHLTPCPASFFPSPPLLPLLLFLLAFHLFSCLLLNVLLFHTSSFIIFSFLPSKTAYSYSYSYFFVPCFLLPLSFHPTLTTFSLLTTLPFSSPPSSVFHISSWLVRMCHSTSFLLRIRRCRSVSRSWSRRCQEQLQPWWH